MKILIVNTTEKKYGGRVYEEMIGQVLSNNFEVEILNVGVRNKHFGYLKIPVIFWQLFKASRRKDIELVIRNFDSCLFLNPKPVKNIAIVHHIDYSFAPRLIRFISFFTTPLILKKIKKIEAIVVVSRYWQEFFKKRDYKNVYLIYNAFDLNDFNFSEKEIEDFKKKYKLEEKPIIYLGNCQEAKGVVESYAVLKNLDCHLVTSGKQEVKIPARNLEVDYREYLKLLKASSIVITMSKFKEGWCRTAHEAMLLKRPVIGSGQGGMKELLEGGKQIICPNFKLLKEKVEYLLKHPAVREKMGEDGYDFAKNFTIENFRKNWLELINKLI